MSIFDEIGKMALGSRIRLVADRLTEDAARIFKLYGIEMSPKWFPVFYVLSRSRDRTITAIAGEIGHSHASVSKIVAEMRRARLVIEATDGNDRRCTVLNLSEMGRRVASKMENQYIDVRAAIEELAGEATHDLWRALEEWDYLLTQRSLFSRVQKVKKLRESEGVRVIPYKDRHHPAFRALNEDWIKSHFKMEKSDRDALERPKENILDRGGFIFVATLGKKPVGVCALIKREDPIFPYELAKMAVSREMRGKNIGWLLAQAAIEKARDLKADRLYLESNTVLKPAIKLYQKLGFRKIVGPATPYERCNIQMELQLKNHHD